MTHWDWEQRPGTVYFAEFCADGLLKIGWTSNLGQRLAYLASHERTDLRLHGSMPGTIRDEKSFHKALAPYRVGPDKQCETFRICDEVLAAVPLEARIEPRIIPFANRPGAWHSPQHSALSAVREMRGRSGLERGH